MYDEPAYRALRRRYHAEPPAADAAAADADADADAAGPGLPDLFAKVCEAARPPPPAGLAAGLGRMLARALL